jgi:hypothetical protein
VLSSQKNILEYRPPFLMESPTGVWTLVVKIVSTDNSLKLLIVHDENGEFEQRSFIVTEPPFYVGADVWELEYGSVLMTLNHPSLHDHPANQLWEKWLVRKKEI